MHTRRAAVRTRDVRAQQLHAEAERHLPPALDRCRHSYDARVVGKVAQIRFVVGLCAVVEEEIVRLEAVFAGDGGVLGALGLARRT